MKVNMMINMKKTHLSKMMTIYAKKKKQKRPFKKAQKVKANIKIKRIGCSLMFLAEIMKLTLLAQKSLNSYLIFFYYKMMLLRILYIKCNIQSMINLIYHYITKRINIKMYIYSL